MKKRTPKYTVLRGEVYWLNFKIPAALFRQTTLSLQVVKHSLKTKQEQQAGAYSQIAILKINEYCSSTSPNQITKAGIESAIKGALESLGVIYNSNLSNIRSSPSFPNVPTSITPPSHNPDVITKVFALYREEMLRAESWRMKSQNDIEASIRTLIEIIGDMPIGDVTPPVCRSYKSSLLKYPIYRQKDLRLKGISIDNIINSNISYNTLSITTINNQIRKVSAFFNWSVKQGYIISNPIQGMKVKQKASLKSARLPFDDENLKHLFASSLYTEHNFSKDYKFWLPLLGLYTGARLEELCQLHLSDINLTNEVPYINVSDEQPEQHLKNNSSKRKVPIHPELFELGFERFIEGKQENDCLRLFDYLVPQRQKLGHKPSIWFGKYKRSLGITDKKKVFHSFRHTIVAKLISVKAPAYELKSMLGHQHGSITYDLYGSEHIDIQPIYEMLIKISYKNVTTNIKPWS